MTFKKDVIVGNIPNENVYWGLFEYAKSKGVPVYERMCRGDFKSYPYIVFSSEELVGTSGNSGTVDYTWITINQFIEYCDNWKPTTVQLNTEYTAEVDWDKKVVKVGCQTIGFDKVEELYKLTLKK